MLTLVCRACTKTAFTPTTLNEDMVVVVATFEAPSFRKNGNFLRELLFFRSSEKPENLKESEVYNSVRKEVGRTVDLLGFFYKEPGRALDPVVLHDCSTGYVRTGIGIYGL